MPEWLLKEDSYDVKKDKDAFMNKSILSILGIITRFRVQTQNRKDRLSINALIKLISALIIIILVSLARSFAFVLTSGVALLLLINLLTIEEIKYILKVSLLVSLFTFIILLPSILMGYGSNAVMVTLKVLISLISINMVACTTQWNELIGTLKLLYVPDMFIFVLDITIKYIIILGEFSLELIYALKLRSVGRSREKSTSLSGIVGTMFIKSKEMAEEMYGAMECRGFTGEYRCIQKAKLRKIDYLCIFFNLLYLGVSFYFNYKFI